VSNVYRLPPRPIDTHDLRPKPNLLAQYWYCVLGAALFATMTVGMLAGAPAFLDWLL
jgi:hypothetical protein